MGKAPLRGCWDGGRAYSWRRRVPWAGRGGSGSVVLRLAWLPSPDTPGSPFFPGTASPSRAHRNLSLGG